MRRKAITFGQLPDLSGTPATNIFLHCDKCGARYSAHKGDYWNRFNADVCECGHCEKPLRLVREVTRFVDVRV